ncbi:hypothetical protein ml_346 [Mollivirus sibericum]|uniref:hypothetical protein n=1 Tax=Mollivirus sibericum TaxID=1678078 RepID=UPI0006B2DD00|nr:hypothetical protein ml_346 [Mollivirus sibericum]ALD62148.1 hypothetical protein ml_346 [Mollivirus sibericum]
MSSASDYVVVSDNEEEEEEEEEEDIDEEDEEDEEEDDDEEDESDSFIVYSDEEDDEEDGFKLPDGANEDDNYEPSDQSDDDNDGVVVEEHTRMSGPTLASRRPARKRKTADRYIDKKYVHIMCKGSSKEKNISRERFIEIMHPLVKAATTHNELSEDDDEESQEEEEDGSDGDDDVSTTPKTMRLADSVTSKRPKPLSVMRAVDNAPKAPSTRPPSLAKPPSHQAARSKVSVSSVSMDSGLVETNRRPSKRPPPIKTSSSISNTTCRQLLTKPASQIAQGVSLASGSSAATRRVQHQPLAKKRRAAQMSLESM